MKHFALIGDPVAHSRSPEIYEKLFLKHGIDADFSLLRVPVTELHSVRYLTASYSGFAVTMPHKKKIIPYLDHIDDTAERCGAVNIVEKRDGILIGHNTDGDGLCDVLKGEGLKLEGKRAYILGRGGAALSAAHAFIGNGCEPILLVRNGDVQGLESETVNAYHSKADIFINATPLGMKGQEEFEYIPLIESIAPEVILDMVYISEGKTKLIQYACDNGIKALDGNSMLYMQALRAFRIFTGIDA